MNRLNWSASMLFTEDLQTLHIESLPQLCKEMNRKEEAHSQKANPRKSWSGSQVWILRLNSPNLTIPRSNPTRTRQEPSTLIRTQATTQHDLSLTLTLKEPSLFPTPRPRRKSFLYRNEEPKSLASHGLTQILKVSCQSQAHLRLRKKWAMRIFDSWKKNEDRVKIFFTLLKQDHFRIL